jgi:hypothetical protein
MICYLWFSTRPPPTGSKPRDAATSFRNSPATSILQLQPSSVFVNFMQKVLETTQVSQSVIVLSIYYIYRLKERNRCTSGHPGSEFRIAVAALMMANKFLDDNTYTNKTWSEVSGIDLAEINKMEREFMMGIDFGLYVDKSTYETWLNLLKGLVMSKERDTRRWRKSRSRITRPTKSGNPLNAALSSPPRPVQSSYRGGRPPYYRARSSSPRISSPLPPSQHVPLTLDMSNIPFQPPMHHRAQPQAQSDYSTTPSRPSGTKRTAGTAFSPTSSTFAQFPAKRPPAISLEIPPARGSVEEEPLQGFAKLSLGSSPAWIPSTATAQVIPQTLASAYQFNDRVSTVVPENLYFYSLACSPVEDASTDTHRKARLRYHQPPPPTATSHLLRPSAPSRPMNIQSARSSPRDFQLSVASPPIQQQVYFDAPRPNRLMVPAMSSPLPQPQPPTEAIVTPTSPIRSYYIYPHHQQYVPQPPPQQTKYEPAIPLAPFANAGPPGVQFYAPTMPVLRETWVYPHWSR